MTELLIDFNAECWEGASLLPQHSVAANTSLTSSTWCDKTPTQILEDVNAALEKLHEPPPLHAYANVPLFGMHAYDTLMRRQGPIPGSYWDFDRLIVPEPQATWLRREWARDRRRFLNTWYRAKKRHRRKYAR